MQFPSAESSLLLHLLASFCVHVFKLHHKHPANCQQHLLCFLQTRYWKAKQKCDQLLKCLIRLFAAVVPLTVAFGISNLVTMLQYAGLSGFILSFFFPTALQLQSIRVCKKTFRGVCTVQAMFPADDAKEKGKHDSMKLSTGGHIVCSPQEKKPRNESSLYMTPYSTRILSHPIAVIVIGAIGGLLLLLTIGSLFFKPEKLQTCLGE